MGQSIGTSVQFAIAQHLAVARQCRRIRAQPSLVFEQAMHAHILGERPLGSVPVMHHVLQLGILQQRQFTDTAVAILADAVQQTLPVCKQALHAGGVKKVRGIGQGRLNAFDRFLGIQVEIQLRVLAVPLQPLDLQTRCAGAAALGIGLVVEHHLEQRVITQAAFRLQRFDQLLERQVLMGLGLHHAFASVVQQLAKAHLPVDVSLENLCVDEKADEALGLRAIAVGHRHADANVPLTAVAIQHRLE
ncbi:hypothetical protein GCM10009086_25220 [Pseudomonas rhodesiae]